MRFGRYLAPCGASYNAVTGPPHKLYSGSMERLTLESNDHARERLGFELPPSDMGEDPFETLKKFYRIYPHFSRVEP